MRINFLIYSLFLAIGIMPFTSSAQHLTISTSGEAGTSGTNWSISGNTLTASNSGNSNIHPSVIQNHLASNPLTVYAGSVIFNANITSSTANNLSIWSNTHITNTSATTITTQGGNVLFASNVDDATDGEATTNGYIQLRFGITINTNGGNITFGGGNTSGTDYALGSNAEAYTEGIRFEAVIALNSGGGNISLRGKSYAMGVQLYWGASGVGFYYFSGATGTINSGTGTITIDGFSQTNTSTYASGIYSQHNMTITSANTTADAIRLIGKATGASGEAWGIESEGTLSVLATGIGGGITISTSKQLIDNFEAVYRGETNILAVSGPINILTGQLGGTTNGYLYLAGYMYLGSKAGSAVTNSSSNINIQVDRYYYANFVVTRLATSGSVTIQPNAASFGANTYTSWFNFNENGQTMTNFTFGKSGNATNVYLNTVFTVAGPIKVYGGTIALDANLTTTNNGAISLYSDNPLGLGASRTVTAAGSFNYIPQSNIFAAAVTYPISNLNVSSTGLLIGKSTNTANITFANTTTVAGPITAYGGTITLNANLTTTNNGDISLYTDNALGGLTTTARTITAAGSFNYIPRSDFFSVPVTYPITNLNLVSKGLLIGKPTNTANITFANATTVAGPITAYGGTVTLNANLTTTNNGSISLYSDNPLGGLSTARTLTAAGAFKYIPRTTTFTADVTYPITNLTATSTGLTIGKTTNDKNITITQDVTGPFGIELYGNNVNINSNLTTTGINAIMYLKGNTTIAAGKSITSGGNFTHDGNMTFKSDVNGTAAFGTLGGTFTTLSGGTSTVERYIPAKRAFRFLSPSVTTTTSIRDNWQENGGTDGGLGTHITGLNGSANGFDLTTTNNPSLYTINHTTGAWTAVANTNVNTLSAGTAYRLMVRGDRTVSLTINNPTATPTVLRATGTLKTGNYTPTLNQTANGYSFVGNPYQAPIDIKAVLTASTNMNTDVVYYWDPTLNSRGTYVTRTLGIVNQNSVTSSFNQYLQPGQAVFVKKDNTANVPIMTITENDKSIVSAAAGVFRNASSNEIGVLRANLKASVNNEWTTIEGALALFHSNYSWGATQEDATKLSNLDEEVSFVQNNTSLAIAMQSNPALTDELPIKLNTTRYTNYQWHFELTNYDGLTPYLFDAQNNTFTQIENNTIVPFTVNGQEQTRFKIVFQNGTLNTPDFSNQMVLYPNPGKADSSFYLTGINNAKVSLYNLLGQNLPVETTVDGATTKVKPSVGLSQGVYVVFITQEGKTAQVKWIVE